MRTTKKDLEKAVAELNKIYCKRSKNELMVSSAYGGYGVRLTGKRDKRKRFGWRKGSLRSGQSDVTYGYQTPAKALNDLYATVRSGDLKRQVSYWDKIYAKR